MIRRARSGRALIAALIACLAGLVSFAPDAFAHHARVFVRIASVDTSGSRALALGAVRETLSRCANVRIDDGSALSHHGARVHAFRVTVRTIGNSTHGVRVRASIVVTTATNEAIEFESESTAMVSGGGDERQQLASASRRALASATRRAAVTLTRSYARR